MSTEHLLQIAPTRFLVRGTISPADALAELGRGGEDSRAGAIWLYARGPLRCARDEASADPAAGHFTTTVPPHFVPDQFLVGDIADVPVLLSSGAGETGDSPTPRVGGDAHHGDDPHVTVAASEYAPDAKFQRFVDMAKFSFYYEDHGAAEANGTVYGALGNSAPASFAVRVRPGAVRPSPARAPFTLTRVTITLDADEELDGGQATIVLSGGHFPRRREGHADRWIRRLEATIDDDHVEVEIRPAAGRTDVVLSVQIAGRRGQIRATVPVREAEAPELVVEPDQVGPAGPAGGSDAPPEGTTDPAEAGEEEAPAGDWADDVPAGDPAEGEGAGADVATDRYWTMRMGWGLRSRPAHRNYFRSLHPPRSYPTPISHAWACSPLTGLFFSYWYNANFSVPPDFETTGNGGFGDYFTRGTLPAAVTGWQDVVNEQPEGVDRELAVDQTGRLPWTGTRDLIPCTWLHVGDRWNTFLEEVNFYKWHGKAHHMTLIKVAAWEGEFSGPTVSRIRLYNPLNGKPLPAGAYQFSADGKWFQANVGHSRLAFEFAAGLLGGPTTIRYFSCGPTSFKRVLGPPLRAGEDDTFEDLTPTEIENRPRRRERFLRHRRQDEERARRREEREGAPRHHTRPQPIVQSGDAAFWWEQPTHVIRLYKGTRIGERGETLAGPWATAGTEHAPLPLRMQYFEHDYVSGAPPAGAASAWPARDLNVRPYAGTWIRPTVTFPSRAELQAAHASGGMALPNAAVLDPDAGSAAGQPWHHWIECERWITQEQPGGLSALWRYRSWPHPLHGEAGRDTEWLRVIREHAEGRCIMDRCNDVWNRIADGGNGVAVRQRAFRYLLQLANAAAPQTLWNEFKTAYQAFTAHETDLTDIAELERRHHAHGARTDSGTAPWRQEGRDILQDWNTLADRIMGRDVPAQHWNDRPPLRAFAPTPAELRAEVESHASARADALTSRARELYDFAGPSSATRWRFVSEAIRRTVDDARDGHLDSRHDPLPTTLGIAEGPAPAETSAPAPP